MTTTFTMAALTPKGVRAIVPSDGHLRDVMVWLGTTRSGSFSLSVYDTGNSAGGGAGTRTKLWDSGALTASSYSSQDWAVVDPGTSAISVTAGQQLDLVANTDDATTLFMRYANANGLKFPTGYNTVSGGARPQFGFSYPAIVSAAGWTSTVTDANVTVSTTPPLVLARVT